MKKKFQKNQIIILLSSIFAVTTSASTYLVKDGDTLSQILIDANIKPIYGKKGSLKTAIEMNRAILKKRGNLIHEGQIILLPDGKTDLAIETESISPSREIAQEEVVVVPVPVPVVANYVEEVGHSQDFSQSSYFKISPRFSYVAINTKNDQLGGSDISNLTQSAPGIKGEWRVVLTPKTSISFFGTYDRLSFYKDTNYSLTDTSFSRIGFGIGGDTALNNESWLRYSLQMNQNYFLESLSLTNIQMRSINQGEFNLGYAHNFWSFGKVMSSWGVGAIVMLPSSRDQYNAKLGYGFKVDTSLGFLSKEFQASYTQKFYKVNNTKNQSKEILLQLNIDFAHEK